jgi:NAD-dependent deacetylase
MTERHRLDELLPLPLHLDSRVLVLTGAGVSAESGVPTFRDAGGLWNSHPVEKVASPEGFADDPALVWRFYAERRRDAGSVSPNPGHRALAALERTLGPRFLLVTQNVDDLHHKAGSEHPLEIHGNLFVTRCSVCTRRPFRDERAYAEPPLCDACAAQGKRSYLRPHIVWFGEMLDPAHMQRIDAFMRGAGDNLVFIAAGTSGAVYPAAGLVHVAKRGGASTWLVNAEAADNTSAFDHFVKGKSGEVLPRLFGFG